MQQAEIVEIGEKYFSRILSSKRCFLAKVFRAVVIFLEENTFKLACIPFYMSIPYPDSLSFSAIRGKEKDRHYVFSLLDNIYIFYNTGDCTI